jgi:hypothetical protein
VFDIKYIMKSCEQLKGTFDFLSHILSISIFSFTRSPHPNKSIQIIAKTLSSLTSYLRFPPLPTQGGLQKVADDLKIERIGPQHQAGSDSLLTAAAFFQMVEEYFENDLDEKKFAVYSLVLSRCVYCLSICCFFCCQHNCSAALPCCLLFSLSALFFLSDASA